MIVWRGVLWLAEVNRIVGDYSVYYVGWNEIVFKLKFTDSMLTLGSALPR